MKKVELLKKLKSLEKTMQDTEKAINDLSVHMYPYLGKNISLEYTEYGTIITDDNGSIGTVEDFFIENEI